MVSLADIHEYLRQVARSEGGLEKLKEVRLMCSLILINADVDLPFEFDILEAEKLATKGITRYALDMGYPESFLIQKLKVFLTSQEETHEKLKAFFQLDEKEIQEEEENFENKCPDLQDMIRNSIFFKDFDVAELMKKENRDRISMGDVFFKDVFVWYNKVIKSVQQIVSQPEPEHTTPQE